VCLGLPVLPSVPKVSAPTKATSWAPAGTLKVPSTKPSLACTLLTVLLPPFVTQMLAPSKATKEGRLKPLGPKVVVRFAGYQRRMATALKFTGPLLETSAFEASGPALGNSGCSAMDPCSMSGTGGCELRCV